MEEIEKCNCRFSITDYGYFECDLEKNHEGDHSFTNTDIDKFPSRKYSLKWERNEKKDIIIDMEWVKQNTNLEEIFTELVEEFEEFESFELKHMFESHNDIDFTCYCYIYTTENFKKLANTDYEKFLELGKEMIRGKVSEEEQRDEFFSIEEYVSNKIYDKLNINTEEYNLFITSRVIFYDGDN